jgi:putative nucleotidyltransferase with HDIG domain
MTEAQKKIRYIASRISTIPTLPTVISKMIEMVDNPRTNARTLARVISNDQSLTARILKMANSAFYGFSREISTVDTAIIVMGFNAVKEMGLSLSVFDAFKNIGTHSSFNVNRYWEHSVSTAVASKIAGRYFHLADVEELFVAGLLHDIGKMVFVQYLPEDYKKVEAYRSKHRCNYYEAEAAVVGLTHCDVGAIIANRWHLPQRIESCIRQHHFHKPESAFLMESIVVDLADLISHRVDYGNRGHRIEREIDETLIFLLEEKGFSIDEMFLEECTEQMFVELDSTEFMDIFVNNE